MKKKTAAKQSGRPLWPWIVLALLVAAGVWLFAGDSSGGGDDEDVADVRFREGEIEGSGGGRDRAREPASGADGRGDRGSREGDSRENDVIADRPQLDTGRFLRQRVEHHRRQARLPRSNEQITEGQVGDRHNDPVLRDRLPSKVSTPDMHGDGRILATWPRVVGFQHPLPIVLHAAFTNTDGEVIDVPSQITGRVLNQVGEQIQTVTYVDDGAGGDETPGDHVFTASFPMPEEHLPDHAETYRVLVAAMVGDKRYVNTAGFLYANPSSELTGNYRDQLREGSVVFGAEIEVSRPGRFHLQATIASADGELIGWGQAAAELEPGTHWMEILYYGVMFHDAGIPGPYTISSLSLGTAGRMPTAFNEPRYDVHTTAAYTLEQLTSEPFDNPHDTRAAERAEAELEAFLEAQGGGEAPAAEGAGDPGR